MDLQLVFPSSDLLNSPLTTLAGDICYEISTVTPPHRVGLVTTIYRLEDPIPLMDRDKTKNPKDTTMPEGESTCRKKLAEIQWREAGASRTLVFSHVLRGFDGVPAHKLLKRRNPLSLSQKCHFFTGNDGVKYRWKVVGSIGCILTRDGKEVGRCLERFIADGIFMGKTRFVLHLKPGSESLDMGMILFTFLLVDEKRQQRSRGALKREPGDDDEGDGEADSGPDGENADAGHGG